MAGKIKEFELMLLTILRNVWVNHKHFAKVRLLAYLIAFCWVRIHFVDGNILDAKCGPVFELALLCIFAKFVGTWDWKFTMPNQKIEKHMRDLKSSQPYYTEWLQTSRIGVLKKSSKSGWQLADTSCMLVHLYLNGPNYFWIFYCFGCTNHHSRIVWFLAIFSSV